MLTEEEVETIRASLSEAEEWMWDDHNLTEYRGKVVDLQASHPCGESLCRTGEPIIPG